MRNLITRLHKENTNPPEGAIPLGCPKILPKMFVIKEGDNFDEVYREQIINKAPEGANAYILGSGYHYSNGEGDRPIQYYKVKEE